MDYLDLLKDWERTTANPVIYENIDSLFPAYGFRRMQAGSSSDRWVSPLKLDLSKPKTPNKEKTVIGASDFKFREQGQWDDPVSVIDMLTEQFGTSSIYETYRIIADRFCLEMPTLSGYSAKAGKTTRAKLLEALEDYFVWNLANNSGKACLKTRQYLEGRGFTKDMVARFKFGFVPSWDTVEKYITSPRMRFSKSDLEEACKVRSDEGYTTVGKTHVLAIPYRCGGEIKGFLFRAVEDGIQPKYKANTGLDRKTVFFNIPDDRKAKEITIVEGEMDALTATAAGLENVVAIGGSDLSGDRRNQIFDALNRNTKKITLCLDLDAGEDGKPNGGKRFKAIKKCLHAIFDVSPDFNNVFVACFPEICDPDEYIRKHGAAEFNKLLQKAVPWWEYLNRNLSNKSRL